MTGEQWVEMAKLFFSAVTAIALAYLGFLTANIKKTVDPLPKAIDGAQDEAKRMREEIGRLQGMLEGIAKEKADQALRDTTPVHPHLPPLAVVHPIVEVDQAKADDLLKKTSIIADNTTIMAESIVHPENGVPEPRNPFLPPG